MMRAAVLALAFFSSAAGDVGSGSSSGANSGVLQLLGSRGRIEMGGATIQATCASDTPAVHAVHPQVIHGYAGNRTLTVVFRNVPASCVDVPIDEPCAASSASMTPALFYCVYTGPEGKASQGPFFAHRVLDELEGVKLGIAVHLSCPLPSQETLITISGRGSGNAGVSLNVDVVYGKPDTPEARSIAFAGVPDGNRLTFSAGLQMGAVYTQLGATACPSSARTLWSGFAATGGQGSGSGYNSLCMHPEPEFPIAYNDNPKEESAKAYGAEYDAGSGDVACSVCQMAGRSYVYTQWGRRTCSDDHLLEYEGVVMASSGSRGELVCAAPERATHALSSTEPDLGATKLVSSARALADGSDDCMVVDRSIPQGMELACAVCSTPTAPPYVRWGGSSCRGKTLYVGHMSASAAVGGGGANAICMHPQLQATSNASTDTSRDLIHGMVYRENPLAPSAMLKNVGRDAACAVCQASEASRHVYVQWGRQKCSSGHSLQYSGLIMSSSIAEEKSESLCIDFDRAIVSSRTSSAGASLYMTEMQTGIIEGSSSSGAGDEALYPPNWELGCAVCAAPAPIYTRWGSTACPSGTNILYAGFMAQGGSASTGSSAKMLCMHREPEFPESLDAASRGTDNQGAYLFGVEYKGSNHPLDKNLGGDGACALCEAPVARHVYVQWGRSSCTNGHELEYSGLLMSSGAAEEKGEHVCVDLERAVHSTSSSVRDPMSGSLYLLEMQPGAADECAYPAYREIACAVCSVPL